LISRGQIPFQITRPPEGKTNGREKEKARRLRQEAANWGESSKKRKRPVKKKMKDGGYVAYGCGGVIEGRRKETKNY
jgi:hypothetical protein